MASMVEVRGTEDFEALSRRIKAHADSKALRRELYRGLNRETKEVRGDMKAAIPGALPSRGGLAALVHADARLSTRSASSGSRVGVRISARGSKHDLASLNRGVLRHPVFGTKTWVEQTAGVEPEFLDEPFERSAPEVRVAISRVMDDIARKVAGYS